jgi:hypothetical protein
MVSALASVMSGRSKVKPILQWDDSGLSEAANAMTLEAVLRGEMREDDGDSPRASSPRHR